MTVLPSFLNINFIIILTYFSAALKNVSIDTEIYRELNGCTCCSYIGPEFNSQLPYGSSQLFVTPVPEGSTLPASVSTKHSCGVHFYICKQAFIYTK